MCLGSSGAMPEAGKDNIMQVKRGFADLLAFLFDVDIVCINQAVTPADDRAQQDEAIHRYYKYLSSECGFILLDGLPADAEVGTLRLGLENLLVRSEGKK